MGLFRLVLALLVACAHLQNPDATVAYWTTSAPVFAVKAFFVISGFYMGLVLDHNYRDKPVGNFYISRALRLLPAYWFVSAATWVAARLLTGYERNFYSLLNPLVAWHHTSPSAWSIPVFAYVTLSITLLLGADTWVWLGFNGREWSRAPDYGPNAASALSLSFVPQAWTLGLEILFYLLVPFLAARRLWVLVVLALGSLAFRIGLAQIGFAGEPWSRVLFPSELIYFVGGLMSYRLYLGSQSWTVPRVALWSAFVAALGIEVSISPYSSAHGSDALLITTVPFVMIALLIPFLFRLTSGSTLDTMLGNLAYPVYLVHLLIYGIVANASITTALANRLGHGWGWLSANLGLVLVGAYLVDRMAVRPVDRIRVRFGARG